MGVYIKGLELPKEFGNYSESYTICISEDGVNILGVEGKLYQVVEVKAPHGRLIDADALRARMYHEAFETDSDMQKWGSGCWIRYKMFERMEEAAPTVFEAEGKDDG